MLGELGCCGLDGSLKHLPSLACLAVVLVYSLKLGSWRLGIRFGGFLALSSIIHGCMFCCCASLFAQTRGHDDWGCDWAIFGICGIIATFACTAVVSICLLKTWAHANGDVIWRFFGILKHYPHLHVWLLW